MNRDSNKVIIPCTIQLKMWTAYEGGTPLARRDDELILLEKKTEALIRLATRKGADVDFHRVRRSMTLGRDYNSTRMFDLAIADLERGIAAANRERIRRSSRSSFVLKIRDIFKFKLW